ncbi:hypothetical protein Shyhy02_40980 [Streptomyces hygroscopicus subsp. hygroscopicus]|nr:hypothetical protein Shyhy02_40980 [Streptomyces hygroscopicus subsp. hygroscopicus]
MTDSSAHRVFSLRMPQRPRARVSDKGAMATTASAGLGDGRRAGAGGETALATAGTGASRDIGGRAFQQGAETFRQRARTALTGC